MRPILAAALALIPGLALAEPSALSAEIAAKGLKATEERLAALPQPNPPDLFALAGLRFLSGVESALQLRWQTGLQADWSELPILRLPIPQNPDARPFTGADLGTLLSGIDKDMEAAREALAQLGDQQFVLEIAVGDLWFDINMNGTRDTGEDVGEVAGLTLGTGRMASVEMIAPRSASTPQMRPGFRPIPTSCRPSPIPRWPMTLRRRWTGWPPRPRRWPRSTAPRRRTMRST
ncbi:hypothetical protein MASR1M65_04150 [Saprospiraceae bacterium]